MPSILNQSNLQEAEYNKALFEKQLLENKYAQAN